MEIRLSQYQAVILNKAIDIFRTRKIRNSTLIDDAYVLQKRLAEWIAVNTSPTGNSNSLSATKADSQLAFNTVINDNRPKVIPIYGYSTYVGNTSAVGVSNLSQMTQVSSLVV